MTEHVIVGGGLAGGLIALALAQAGRGAGVTVVEQDQRLGGNHTWSFHDSDLDGAGHRLVGDLVEHRWSTHEVWFPGYRRELRSGYSTISSGRFAARVGERLAAAGVKLVLGRQVAAVAGDAVQMSDGEVFRGALVLDARGPIPAPRAGSNTEAGDGAVAAGYQKFVGLDLELTEDGPWTVPLLMDARVPQVDGYRFMYVLPFSRRRVLLEDTIYSASPYLNVPGGNRAIVEYATANGVTIERVRRVETGVLPLPMRVSPHSKASTRLSRATAAASGEPALVVGYRGGHFHAVTGYSLPQAVRVAVAVARAGGAVEARAAVEAIQKGLRAQHRFGGLLNRLMFGMMPAASRWTAFERFYRLPEPTIARFYAGTSSWSDQARVLLGRPPRGISWARLFGADREERASERTQQREERQWKEVQ